jgi:AraC-like DNA-binding protein
VPRIQITRKVATSDVTALRALCDGCDPARPCDEHTARASLWLVVAGAFELRDAGGRHMLDPTRAIAMPGDHVFQVRHPAGPDTCIAFQGSVVDALAALNRGGARPVPISPAQIAQITAALADDDDLALAEAVARLAPADARAAPDRDLSAAVADALRARYAEPTSLAELAQAIGYSVFHTCRVFRATTGTTIHGFRRELRLRHALARILDGSEPLAEIAAATGFASQSHLTNLFRARFGITPARARTGDGQRRLRDSAAAGLQVSQPHLSRSRDARRRLAPSVIDIAL